jgi:hypothetical protein
MNVNEFKDYKLTSESKAEYGGILYQVKQVCYEECLLAIDCDIDGGLFWVRCENVHIADS